MPDPCELQLLLLLFAAEWSVPVRSLGSRYVALPLPQPLPGRRTPARCQVGGAGWGPGGSCEGGVCKGEPGLGASLSLWPGTGLPCHSAGQWHLQWGCPAPWHQVPAAQHWNREAQFLARGTHTHTHTFTETHILSLSPTHTPSHRDTHTNTHKMGYPLL